MNCQKNVKKYIFRIARDPVVDRWSDDVKAAHGRQDCAEIFAARRSRSRCFQKRRRCKFLSVFFILDDSKSVVVVNFLVSFLF
jgi:hypothetical protein